MFDRLRARIHRPTPATGIALLALFVALGGTGYAAVKLGKNTVGTAQLKNNAVTGAKVKNGSLAAADFGGTLPSGAQGPKGDTGPKGDAGAKGDPGNNGTNGSNGTDGTDGTDGVRGPTGPSGATLKPKVTGGSQTTSGPITLTNDSWTQSANGPEQVFYKVVWTPPAGGCTNNPGPAGAALTVKLDGVQVQSQQAGVGAGQQTTLGTTGLPSPGSTTQHNVSVEIVDNCAENVDGTVNSATFDIADFG
jgi:collagen triple helix repeat protein